MANRTSVQASCKDWKCLPTRVNYLKILLLSLRRRQMQTSEWPFQDIATFVAVAQNASFTRAAEKLGTSKSNVGKAVQRLEVRLGARMLQRTTRAGRLTEDGELYLDAARAALDGLNEAELALSARRDEPVGR